MTATLESLPTERQRVPLFDFEGARGAAHNLWRYRHLCAHLVGSDLRGRFRRSRLGILWAILYPLAFTMLFAGVLHYAFNQPFREYSLYVFSGFIIWDLFASYIGGGMHALAVAEGYIRQAPIPNTIFIVRSVLNACVIFALAFVGYAIYVALILPSSLGATWLWMPVLLLLMTLLGIPLTTISSFMNLRFRDYQYGIGLVLQALWFFSPAFIARETFEKPGITWFTAINPAASFCDIIRDTTLYHLPPDIYDIGLLIVWAAGLWAIAIYLLSAHGRRVIFWF